MRLNKMNEIPVGTKMFDVFGGYNRTTECGINEGAEMLNMSSEKYPAMAPRAPRGKVMSFDEAGEWNINEMVVNGALYFVDSLNTERDNACMYRCDENGCRLFRLKAANAMAERLIDSEYGFLTTKSDNRHMVKMGAYIVIFPDKLMFNTQEVTQNDDGSFGANAYALEHERTSATSTLKNGYTVSLTKLGSEVQNALSPSSYGRLNSAAYEKKPDAETAAEASYIFVKMVDGTDRPADYILKQKSGDTPDGAYVSEIADDGQTIYKSINDGQMLDLDGALWCDYSSSPPVLYELVKQQYAGDGTYAGATYFKWQRVENPMVKILCNSAVKNISFGARLLNNTETDPGQYYETDKNALPFPRATNGIGKELNVGDYVTITRAIYKYDEDGNRTHHADHTDNIFNKEYRVEAVGEDYIVIDAAADFDALIWASASDVTIGESAFYMGEIVITRKVPEMDFVCEYNNRLYGCSSTNHEIYASKLGDPKSWYCYQGISTDSYAATVGTDGDFTGCTAYGGNVYFFKEDVIHRLYGNAPSNFQLTSYDVPGVAKGSHKSLREVGGVLYYLSPGGVMAYDGNYPVSIHSVFDGQRFKNGVAGRWQNKYYLSVQDEANAHQLLVYDSTRRLWHREDDLPVKVFEEYENHLLAAVSDKVLSLTGGFAPHEDKVQWRFISGTTGTESFNQEHISKMMLRIMADTGTRIKVYLQYDGGEWLHAFSTTATANKPFTIKTIPRRCDTMRYRVDGIGNGKILSACIYTEEGSELNV